MRSIRKQRFLAKPIGRRGQGYLGTAGAGARFDGLGIGPGDVSDGMVGSVSFC